MTKMNNLILILSISLLTCSPLLASSEVEFSIPTDEVEASDGYVKLTWQSHLTDPVFELQKSDSWNFANSETVYKGPDKARFVSGLNSGVYYYRVRVGNGEWSETLKVTAVHQSMELAYTLLIIGFIVFSITTVVVIRGAQKYKTS